MPPAKRRSRRRNRWRPWRRRLRRAASLVAVAVLAGDGVAAVAIQHHNQHPQTAPVPTGPPLGCPAVVLPPVPSPAPPVSEAAAKADAVGLVKGLPGSAASARAMTTSDYLGMCGVPATLDSGTYAAVWVVTVRTAGAVFTAVIDAGANRVVGTCEGPACSGVPPGH